MLYFPSYIKIQDSKWTKNMDINPYDQLLIMPSTIEANRQDYDDKMKNITEYLTSMITSMTDQIKFLWS